MTINKIKIERKKNKINKTKRSHSVVGLIKWWVCIIEYRTHRHQQNNIIKPGIRQTSTYTIHTSNSPKMNKIYIKSEHFICILFNFKQNSRLYIYIFIMYAVSVSGIAIIQQRHPHSSHVASFWLTLIRFWYGWEIISHTRYDSMTDTESVS